MAPAAAAAADVEEWLGAMRQLAAESAESSKSQLPPLPDLSGASMNEKAVFLFMRGIGAAELGDMRTAETMVRYALKVSPELSAPMSEWPGWAKEVARRMIEAQTAGRRPKQEEQNTCCDVQPALVPAAVTMTFLVVGILGAMWTRFGRRTRDPAAF
eukprot:TRINITY_DN67394_c0_g1_i1.p1 TRINITY_DN67394_c0_g1~~TRINITY_DN67394_c0_g1_i1.p1  ORF type:complete len:157 (+),score=41.45 TRINITY_DN67394_c0_g1_i1:27-497(+)